MREFFYTLKDVDELQSLEKIGQFNIEIRSDIFNCDEIKKIIDSLKKSKFKILLSKRSSEFEIHENCLMDGAIEFTTINSDIISCHEFLDGESLSGLIKRVESVSLTHQIIKIAPLVDKFNDLELGHRWQQAKPEKRVFLPRSRDGRWRWYRLFMKGKMPLNFWSYGGEIKDQPGFVEVDSQKLIVENFACVLGDPIDHSQTPLEQSDFFSQYKMNVYKIKLSLDEFNQGLKVLLNLGLKCAAITSPLKKIAFEYCDFLTKYAQELSCVNTIYYQDKKIHGQNTDHFGLKKLLSKKLESPIIVWGGGGVLNAIKKELNNAHYYSARSGQSRSSESELEEAPKTIIWACGNRGDESILTSKGWSGFKLIDLNYNKGSLGREIAEKLNLEYTSGIEMFKEQARQQRVFWNKCFKGEFDE